MRYRFAIKHKPLSRRAVLRGAGVAVTLPLLEAMTPIVRAAETPGSSADQHDESPRRMFAICTPYGIHGPMFTPQQAGRDYELPPYLKILENFRDQFTVFSGVTHPEVDGAHASESSFLTAAPRPGGTSFKNSISLDQFAAERTSGRTRFARLTLSTVDARGLSWTSNGVQIPADNLPSAVFAKLFLDGTADEVRAQVRKLRQGRSILDTVRGEARRLENRVADDDREKLDQYFTSVRNLETDLTNAEEWAYRPKPKVNVEPPTDSENPADLIGRTQLMYDLARLALQTDSTRLITLMVSGTDLVPPLEGVREGHHALSHHGNKPEKIQQMQRVESTQFEILRDLLATLAGIKEQDQSLLDRTMVLYGSNLGNANSHTTANMPMLLAGGGFKHGQHLAFDTTNNYPLPNLYVSMLQRMGIETDAFASSTGTMRGLEMI